ncbi:MAG: hypothetical protein KZQ80_17560 [Candidatus Thiodiazotropha sp. (ex Monitilora ramsayi)]|nr:hypothetical protein [Candidatus Thiodiazotropha sp. (ex Monitilora ramsayi)]
MREKNKNINASLEDWAKITKSNAEIDYTGAMFAGILSTSPIVDRFAMWLLAGCGATAALMTANINNILPILTVEGFKYSMVFLLLSALAGFLAKYYAIRCQVMYEADKKIRELAETVSDCHMESDSEIQEVAGRHGVHIDAGVDIKRISEEFVSAFPNRNHKKLKTNMDRGIHDRLVAYKDAVKYLRWQGYLTFVEVLLFLAFVLTVIFYAKAI